MRRNNNMFIAANIMLLIYIIVNIASLFFANRLKGVSNTVDSQNTSAVQDTTYESLFHDYNQYYVNLYYGSDNNDGLSWETAWKTDSHRDEMLYPWVINVGFDSPDSL